MKLNMYSKHLIVCIYCFTFLFVCCNCICLVFLSHCLIASRLSSIINVANIIIKVYFPFCFAVFCFVLFVWLLYYCIGTKCLECSKFQCFLWQSWMCTFSIISWFIILLSIVPITTTISLFCCSPKWCTFVIATSLSFLLSTFYYCC